MKALHVGDEVSFLGREGHGKIIKISSNQFLIEDDLGFETWIEKSEVIARLDFTIKLPEPGKKKPEKKVKVSNPKPTTDQVNWETPKIKIKKVKKPVKESDLIFILTNVILYYYISISYKSQIIAIQCKLINLFLNSFH
jgi:hypothetical protein